MVKQTRANLLMDERAYAATRVVLATVAWVLVLTGAVTSTEDLTGSLMVGATSIATVVTVGVLFAVRSSRVSFGRILVWAAPADLVTMGLLVVALYRFGDPVFAVVIIFAVFYGHVLERRAALYVTMMASLVYVVSHLAADPLIDWYGALFLGIKGVATVYVGVLSAVLSERHREHQRHIDDVVVEREILTRELQQRVDELQAISDITGMIHSSLELERVGASIVRILCEIVAVPRACVLVMDKGKNETLFSASAGLDTEDSPVPGRFRGGGEFEYAGHHLSCMSMLDHKSMLVLFCADPDAMERFTDRESTVLQAVSSALAVALENSQLYTLTRRLAITDELTGLSNYRHLQQRLDEEVERARRYHKDLSLLLLDADDFKRFNDTQGHLAGDHALAALGRIIRSTIREVDLAARYGGEEFSVILPETDASGAFIVAEKIREAIAAHEFDDSAGEPGPRLTVSIGLASFPVHSHDKESLLKQSDDALYQAKSGGKNRVRVAQADVRSEQLDGDTADTNTEENR